MSFSFLFFSPSLSFSFSLLFFLFFFFFLFDYCLFCKSFDSWCFDFLIVLTYICHPNQSKLIFKTWLWLVLLVKCVLHTKSMTCRRSSFLCASSFKNIKKKRKKIFLQTNFYANGIKVLYGGLTTQRRKLRHLKFFLTYGDFIKRTRLNLLWLIFPTSCNGCQPHGFMY